MRSVRAKRLGLGLASILFLGGLFWGLSPWSASGHSPLVVVGDSLSVKGTDRIILKHADQLTYNREFRADVQRLIGNVVFEHKGAVMTCDSAYLNEQDQIFEAFGEVHMTQHDTLNIYGKYLFYNGLEEMAKLRQDVRLENKTATLYTDSLDYDRRAGIAYYFDGGSIVDSRNTLTSGYGEYRPDTDDAEFRIEVHLENDRMTLDTEHLLYNTKTKISQFLGETVIRQDSGEIRSSRGIYDTEQEVGILLDRSVVLSSGRTLTGDSIYYDGKKRFSEVFGRMEITDTMQQLNLYGDYGYYEESKRYAFATGRAYAMSYKPEQDSTYIGADTLELITYRLEPLEQDSLVRQAQMRRQREIDSLDVMLRELHQPLDSLSLDSLRQAFLGSPDSLSLLEHSALERQLDSLKSLPPVKVDSLQRIMLAYHHVRVFSRDYQAVGDSLRYLSQDSVMRLYGSPILWYGERQLSGDSLRAYKEGEHLREAEVLGRVLLVEHLADADLYNQLKGDSLIAHFRGGEVKTIDILGDVDRVFYMQDEKTKKYNGLNRQSSKAMYVHLDSSRIEHILWLGPVSGKVYPMRMASGAEINRLEGFHWSDKLRPKRPEDVVAEDALEWGKRYSLEELRRYSGVNAAKKAYLSLEQSKEGLPEDFEGAASQAVVERELYPHPYIQRSSSPEKDRENNRRSIDSIWPYSTVQEDLESSTTNPSTGIRAVKSLKRESPSFVGR